MGTITLTNPSAGTVVTAGLHATNYTTIQTVINGNLDANNWGAGKIFAPSKLTQEGASTGQVLAWSGSQWAPVPAAGAPTYQTTLPGSPSDGQQTILVDSTTAPTYAWFLRYNSTSTKWDFLGGAPIFSEVATSETTTSATYAALTTAGPSITVPVAGDYLVEIGMTGRPSVNAVWNMSYDIGGTGAVDADSVQNSDVATGGGTNGSRVRKKTAIAASTALTAKYKISTGTLTALDRWMRVTPIRVG